MKIDKFLSPVLKTFLVLCLVLVGAFKSYGQDEMQDAKVTLTFSEADSTKTIMAKAVDQTGLPIEDLELYFYVKRTFSLLPIGDAFNSTDENGEIEVVFPDDLPAEDADGTVTIVVEIKESDLYNDLTLETTKNWGVPVQIDRLTEKRSLWASSANAPISLVTIVSLMILCIWYVIFYIIFKLYKVSRIKPQSQY